MEDVVSRAEIDIGYVQGHMNCSFQTQFHKAVNKAFVFPFMISHISQNDVSVLTGPLCQLMGHHDPPCSGFTS